MNKKILSGGSIALAIVLLLTINILSGVVFKSSRLDMTENNLYTLSKGTKNIINNFDEPVTLRLYFSEKVTASVPVLSSYGKRVRELLGEYAAASGGNVQLQVLDPEPFSDAEDQAVQHGLQGVPVDAAGSVAYFGLVGTNATDDRETIPFFQLEKESSLEYDITKLVYKLGNPKKRVVGLMTALPMQATAPANPFMQPQPGGQDWMILTQMKQAFDVRMLSTDIDKIPGEIDVLMLVHPKNLGNNVLYAIDQFVLGGGHALVFVDPHGESDQPPHDPQNPMAAMSAPRNSDLGKLFDAWGIELVAGQLAADIDSATRVGLGQGRSQSVEYVAWLSLTEDNFDKYDFVTSELKQITMASAGYLRLKQTKKDGDSTSDDASNSNGIKFMPMIRTSSRAMSIPSSSVQFRPNPVGLLDNYRPGKEKLALAGRITGMVKSAWPLGAPEGVTSKNPLKESKSPINVIVVADVDMLEDRFWVNVQNFLGQRIAIPRANNGAFVINAIDNLSGSNDLISLRSRANFSKPFERLKEIQRDAEKQFRSRETELQAKLRETEQKLQDMQRQKGSDASMILSREQQREISRFREEQVKTRKELRNVQHELRKNIESLGSTLKFINIALVPLLIILFAIGLSVMRHKRMDQLTATQ